jgi:enamine deaminase RidA (YjgF/YER057c/UK114 family)
MSSLQEIYEVFPSDSTCLQPLGIRVDGLIAGQGISAGDYRTGESRGDVASQLQTCLSRMQELVQRGGASLTNIGRAVCYVTTPEDREPVYEAWERLFPDSDRRPAFKVLTGPLQIGQLVKLDVLAVAGAVPRRIDIEGVPARDPTVVVGNYVFTSRLHGISPETHQTVTGLAPQLMQAMANVDLLLRDAGADDRAPSQLTLFARDETTLSKARALLPHAASVALHGLKTWVRADSEAMVEATAALGEAAPFRELFIDEPSNQASGCRIGSLIFSPAISGAHGRGTNEQIHAVLEKMDRLLRLAGSNRGEVARVSFYMRDIAERPILNQVWQEWYADPDDRPPHTYLPVALPSGQNVALQVIALAGASRRVLKVEGVEHGDPMSLGAVTGNLLTSSRIFGAGGRETPEGLVTHTERCFANADALLGTAGLDWQDLSQLVAYGSSPDFRAVVAGALHQGRETRLDFLETDLGRGTLLPRLQLLGLTK